MLSLCIAFVVSMVITLRVIRYDHLHGHLSADHDMAGVQKFHAVTAPRIGGGGVLVGAVWRELSAAVAVIILGGLAYMAAQVGGSVIVITAYATVGGIAGSL